MNNINIDHIAEDVAIAYSEGYAQGRFDMMQHTRGEWIEGHYGIECSNCGREVVYYEGDDGKWHYEYFCPHCGADMRGEHNDK